MIFSCLQILFFFFNDTATTEIYTLSLHDALPILLVEIARRGFLEQNAIAARPGQVRDVLAIERSEEHTSELQSQSNLVCRLLLEKKKLPLISNVKDEDIEKAVKNPSTYEALLHAA